MFGFALPTAYAQPVAAPLGNAGGSAQVIYEIPQNTYTTIESLITQTEASTGGLPAATISADETQAGANLINQLLLGGEMGAGLDVAGTLLGAGAAMLIPANAGESTQFCLDAGCTVTEQTAGNGSVVVQPSPPPDALTNATGAPQNLPSQELYFQFGNWGPVPGATIIADDFSDAVATYSATIGPYSAKVQNPSNYTYCITDTYGTVNCNIDASGNTIPIGVQYYVIPNYTVPPGGLNCSGSGYVVTGQPAGSLSCSEAAGPGGGAPTPIDNLPNVITPSESNLPANPQMVADIANGIINQITNLSTGGPSGGIPASGSGPVTAGGVADWQQKTGAPPITIGQLKAPVSTGTIQPNTNGVPQITGTVNPVPALTPAQTPPTTAQQQAAPACGNVQAGQVPCGVYEDSPLPQDALQGMPQLQIAPLLQPQTQPQVETLPLPQSFIDPSILTQTGPVTISPPNVPPISLPFDEWPQVMQTVTGAGPSFVGVCPTIPWTSVVLHTTFVFGVSSCVLFEALRGYMVIFCGPTYMVLALMLILRA
jgi:hypothetical protein